MRFQRLILNGHLELGQRNREIYSKNMRVLVTGATGLVGNKLIEMLLARGVEVAFLTTAKDKLDVLKGCSGYYWNPQKQSIDSACIEKVEVIIHLAGSSINGSWSAKGKELISNSRVDASQTLYQLLSNQPHQVKQIICASAVGIYDTLDRMQDEEDYIPATNYLGTVVNQWETANKRFETLGLQVCILRIGLVLARTGGALPKMEQIAKCYIASPLGTGNQYYSWIHLSDLARIFLFVMDHHLAGVFNAVAPKPETNENFTKKLCIALGRPLFFPAVPSWVLRFVLGEKEMLVTKGQQISCHKLEQSNFKFHYLTLEEAFAALYSEDKINNAQ